MDLSRAEIDGVPALWADTGDDPVAGMIFRVGRADETLATSGITHLVEHLALCPLGVDTRAHHNGRVGDTTTIFQVQGGPGNISAFFSALCGSLRDLPLTRLEAEKRVMRTEEAAGDGAVGALLARRYGAASYGLAGFPEDGLSALTAQSVTEWVRAWFTRGNAALFMTCPPPKGLRLDLPEGPAMPPPSPTSALPVLPASFHAAVDGVACSAVVARCAAAEMYHPLLQRRLRHALWARRKLSDSPWVMYTVRDRQAAHLEAMADGPPESQNRLVRAFITEIERLGTALATKDEVRMAASVAASVRGSAAGTRSRLIFTARDNLMGLDSSGSFAEWRARVFAVTPHEIRAVASEVLGSALVMLPTGTSLP